ncbi:GNAT family N-acetyltransferase [Azospirillum brasilense]|uniref:GNAT family N-acetyltransferase n=1 Tax=Azospirillum brasilense TaxID=192 RepID=UPI000E69113A|nr:GNAT family N-acetyltransferase [Azospirillum brasilense]NUB25377.1 GNAT family N-acetyltransferase [Azospirillum brasilense]NUB32449.1 GNAT family N-acetyltransferase [Azospirillum brasilense]RIW01093.1 GNAT family N-acetyltransferase [Azospirillum brasilense]
MDAATASQDVISLPVTIRPACRTDLSDLEWFGLHTPHREILATAFRAQERGSGALLVAEINGFPAGQICIDFQRRRHLRRATLWALRVFQPFRNRGIATRLMVAAEGAALDHGYSESELGVDRDNGGVLAFYERLGYELRGTERGRYSYRTPAGELVQVPIDQWIMRKPLFRQAAWQTNAGFAPVIPPPAL